MRPLLTALLCLSALHLAACKDQETQQKEKVEETAAMRMEDGKKAMEVGNFGRAIGAFKSAASIKPDDPMPALLLAEAHKEAGNDDEAILALRQASELTKGKDPGLRKQLADLYRRAGYIEQCIAVLGELHEAQQLTDEEILQFAKMQANAGDTDGAFKTLEAIQRRNPDDPDAKIVEAEILLLSGDELLAATLMDRLIGDQPHSVPIRLLRAQYFMNNDRADLAENDLQVIKGASAELPEVVEMRAKVLNAQSRHDEAETELRKLQEARPKDAAVLAQLAETKLMLRQFQEAEVLIEQAIAIRPRFARALYVQGRALEAQGNLPPAVEAYRGALREDPTFAPALSRLWRMSLKKDEKVEAVNQLERLFFMNAASAEEKVQLAKLYADLKMNGWRARKLADEALRRDPKNPEYKELKAAVMKIPGGTSRPKSGVVIWRGR